MKEFGAVGAAAFLNKNIYIQKSSDSHSTEFFRVFSVSNINNNRRINERRLDNLSTA
jgi:hypothetical protein